MAFIKGIASLGAAMLIGLSAPPAQAGYVVDLTQQGSNVVATGSGPIDLTGLTRLGGILSEAPRLSPSAPSVITGPTSGPLLDGYTGVSGPANFGSGHQTIANSGSGDFVGIFFGGELDVPHGYVSDSPLSDSATYDDQTFISLGATPGTYKWTWGSGANQNFTLVIGAVVPEPSTWAMMLFGFAGLGFMGYQSAGRRRRTARSA
jgi:PEP-CTERM motif-containing protein